MNDDATMTTGIIVAHENSQDRIQWPKNKPLPANETLEIAEAIAHVKPD
jgi:hypothetical protein